MGDFGFAVSAVRFVIAGSYGENKVPRMTLALSDQEAAVLALLCQQLLGFTARKMTMKPPWENEMSRFRKRICSADSLMENDLQLKNRHQLCNNKKKDKDSVDERDVVEESPL